MLTITRIIGFICAWAACERTFPPPEVPNINRPVNKSLEIRTNSGKVGGYYMTSLGGNLIGAFEGIPYAENPVGSLRFRDPVRKRPWKGILKADRRVRCIQMDPSRYFRIIGIEACLVLNVYVPLEREQQTKLPVIVWIHGGGWIWGAGHDFGPSYLLDQSQVILVTVNYRLGPLGFMSTGDSTCPGNFGLKDQSLALQWVVENIENFGGDSKRITLGGHSAGAASVHLHMMSPKSKGKFQRGISLSGSALGFWAVPPNQTTLTKRLARSLGCYDKNLIPIVNCMRVRSAKRIVTKQYDLFELIENPSILFGPVVEHGNPSGFLLDSPSELYNRGQVADIPWMTGVTQDEGDIFTLVNYVTPLAIRTLVSDLDTSIPIMLSYNSNYTETTSAIKSYYFGKSPKFSFSGFEHLNSISEMFGDRYFYDPFHRTIQIHSKTIKAPLYTYYFTFHGQHSISEKLGFPSTEWGVMHMDELQYIFNSSDLYSAIKKTDREYLISHYFIELWKNFASTGLPIVIDNQLEYQDRWEPYTPRNPKLLDINFNTGMIHEPYLQSIKFWDSIRTMI